MKNITLSADETLIEAPRRRAAAVLRELRGSISTVGANSPETR